MKTRKPIENEKEVTAASSCCGPSTTATKEVESACCEQPTDGSSCCDKTETKETNSKKTGCC